MGATVLNAPSKSIQAVRMRDHNPFNRVAAHLASVAQQAMGCSSGHYIIVSTLLTSRGGN